MDNFEHFIWMLSKQLMNMVGQDNINHMEPYIEFTESERGVRIVAELAGTRPHDIRVRITNNHVWLNVLKHGLSAFSEVFDSSGLDPGKARIHYRNEVLEISVPYRKTPF